MKLFTSIITLKGFKPVINIAQKQLKKLLEDNDIEYTISTDSDNICTSYVSFYIDINYSTLMQIQDKLERN